MAPIALNFSPTMTFNFSPPPLTTCPIPQRCGRGAATHSNAKLRFSSFMYALQNTTPLIFVVLALLCGTSKCIGQVQGDSLPVPQLVWSTTKGLDYENNAIDRLIHTFGFGCDPTGYIPRPCRIDDHLISLLKKLPAVQTDISRELTSLGATCRMDSKNLNCIYERHVEHSLWDAGSPVPVAILADFFRINFVVSEGDGGLHYEAHFSRREQEKQHRTN